MEEQNLQTAVETSLIKSIEGIQKTGTELIDALYEQAPEVVSQLLLWHGIESLLMCLIGFAFLTVPFWLYKIGRAIYINLEVAKEHDQFTFWFPASLVGVICSVLFLMAGFQKCNLTWLKIYIAPKVYLLEYLANFIK